MWHGLFVLHLGKLQTSTQLQQCSVTVEWAELAFLRATKAVGYQQNTAKPLFIPADDSQTPGDDHPAPDLLLLFDMHLQYHQRDLDSCLRDSMSSAFHAMGFVDKAKFLAHDESLSGPTVDLLFRASKLVRTVF